MDRRHRCPVQHPGCQQSSGTWQKPHREGVRLSQRALSLWRVVWWGTGAQWGREAQLGLTYLGLPPSAQPSRGNLTHTSYRHPQDPAVLC